MCGKVAQVQVLLALSEGADSTVVGTLLHRTIGSQITCEFVDHGLLRLNEGDQVMQTLATHLGVKVVRVNASERFSSGL